MEIVFFSLRMHVWEVCALIGGTLILSEIFVPGFFLFPIGIALLITAFTSVFIHSWAILFGILSLCLLVIFYLFKKFVYSYFKKSSVYTNTDGMIGQECTVVEAISPQKNGYVKLYGDRWEAKTMRGENFDIGERVIITKLDGNKVVIHPLNDN